MDTYTIDVEIEHYYGDRMASTSREACRRLYVRSVAKFRSPELEKYISRIEGHAVAYASVSKTLQSPFRHIETPLFLSSLVLFVASVLMMVTGETTALVAGGFSGGLVGMINCARKLAGYWEEYAVREAVFRELAEKLHESK